MHTIRLNHSYETVLNVVKLESKREVFLPHFLTVVPLLNFTILGQQLTIKTVRLWQCRCEALLVRCRQVYWDSLVPSHSHCHSNCDYRCQARGQARTGRSRSLAP